MLDPGTKECLQTIGSHSLLFPYFKLVGEKIVTLILISLPFFFLPQVKGKIFQLF